MTCEVTKMRSIRMLPAGEQGLVIEFGSAVNDEINADVHRLAKQITAKMRDHVVEVVPTYRSLLVYYNPLIVARADLINKIENLLSDKEEKMSLNAAARVVNIPVCYGNEFGPDIEFVASHNNLTVEEVIKIHTSRPYLVYMLGFTPGFPYLGGMSEKIATPRLKTPRTSIPAGSVGIAGNQTGFYPIASPGGWQLIGRTPVKAFNKDSDNPFLFEAGDYLRFEAVNTEDFYAIQELVKAGRYKPVTSTASRGGVTI